MAEEAAAKQKPSFWDYKMMGMPIAIFIIFSVVVICAALLNQLPKNLFGGLAASAVVGCWLQFIVEKVKIIKKTIGLALVAIGAALLVYWNVIPQNMIAAADNYISGNTDFLGYYVGALLCGSILGMERKLLIRAGSRYFVPIIGGVIAAYGLAALAGKLLGLGVTESVMFVAAPIMGGGNGAGAVPMSEIYAQASGLGKEAMYSKLFPMVEIGNWISIFFAVVLNMMGKKNKKLTGDGVLMEGFTNEDAVKTYPYQMTQADMACGLLMACGFILFGRIVSKFVPAIHAYAFTIVTIAILKIAGLVPERVEFGAVRWYRFMMDHFTIIIMGGVGMSMLSIKSMLLVLNPTYLTVAVVTILGAVLGAGLLGIIVKFFFVESAITAGLCMSNAGGNGDIMVLSACNRMELMCFAQISSRLGGALILVIQSVFALLFFR